MIWFWLMISNAWNLPKHIWSASLISFRRCFWFRLWLIMVWRNKHRKLLLPWSYCRSLPKEAFKHIKVFLILCSTRRLILPKEIDRFHLHHLYLIYLDRCLHLMCRGLIWICLQWLRPKWPWCPWTWSKINQKDSKNRVRS